MLGLLSPEIPAASGLLNYALRNSLSGVAPHGGSSDANQQAPKPSWPVQIKKRRLFRWDEEPATPIAGYHGTYRTHRTPRRPRNRRNRRDPTRENVSLEYEEHCVGEFDAPGDDEAAELAGHAQEAAGDDGEDDLDET